MEVRSERLGLYGKLDLLEVFVQPNGIKSYLPVEYKRGKRKVNDWDRIQLCAQALCMEEMYNVSITEGALWYWQERLREVVLFDERLRAETLDCVNAARSVLQTQITPPPTPDPKRCKACSLVNECAPFAVRKDRSIHYAQALFKAPSEN